MTELSLDPSEILNVRLKCWIFRNWVKKIRQVHRGLTKTKSGCMNKMPEIRNFNIKWKKIKHKHGGLLSEFCEQKHEIKLRSGIIWKSFSADQTFSLKVVNFPFRAFRENVILTWKLWKLQLLTEIIWYFQNIRNSWDMKLEVFFFFAVAFCFLWKQEYLEPNNPRLWMRWRSFAV